MMCYRYKLFAFFFTFSLILNVYSQSNINGNVYSTKGGNIEEANIILYNRNNDILEYTTSNEKGFFSFNKRYETGIYTVECTRLGFSKTKQSLIIGTDENKSVHLDLYLEQSIDMILAEVEIKTQKPIIVKKDTIIYNIKSFTNSSDESLESVLSRIEGIKVYENGDISINGKMINKVLIDGKEVSDFGNAIITKSLSPEKVKSVEVRFDEKDNKIKESLLNDEKFLVLDIKLNSDFKKSFFGKQYINVGFQDNFKYGFFSNFFSLNKKINSQYYGENNSLGDNLIKIEQIKNIGKEAFDKIFSLPTDFRDVLKSEGYNEEIYGFNNFTKKDISIVGISQNINLSDKTSCFIGSFNQYNFLKNSSQEILSIDYNPIYKLTSIGKNSDLNSKNKIQIKHTTNLLKINFDINYTYQKSFLLKNTIIDFDNQDQSINNVEKGVYINNKIEYIYSDKIGFLLGVSYVYNNNNRKIDFNIFDNNVLNFLFPENNNIDFYNFHQNIYSNNNSYAQTFKMKYKQNKITHYIGYRGYFDKIDLTKKSNVILFSNANSNYFYKFHSLTYDTNFFIKNLNVVSGNELTLFNFPFENSRKNKYYFQNDLKLLYSSSKSNLSLVFNRKIAAFPLLKIVDGYTFIDDHSVFIPNNHIFPYFNTMYSASYSSKLNSNFDLTIALLKGISNNLNNQLVENLVFNHADQLRSKFFMFSTSIKKTIKKDKLFFILEPEYIDNSEQFYKSDSLTNSKSNNLLIGLKINYIFKNNLFLYYYPKYSSFVRISGLNESDIKFNFITNYLKLKYITSNKKFNFNIDYKQVNFIQKNYIFNNFNFSIEYHRNKTKYFVDFYNLYNSSKFLTQDLYQSLLIEKTNNVFERYVKFGVKFEFN